MYIQVSLLFANINEYAYLLHSSVEGKVKRKNILHSVLMSRPYLRLEVPPPNLLGQLLTLELEAWTSSSQVRKT